MRAASSLFLIMVAGLILSGCGGSSLSAGTKALTRAGLEQADAVRLVDDLAKQGIVDSEVERLAPLLVSTTKQVPRTTNVRFVAHAVEIEQSLRREINASVAHIRASLPRNDLIEGEIREAVTYITCRSLQWQWNGTAWVPGLNFRTINLNLIEFRVRDYIKNRIVSEVEQLRYEASGFPAAAAKDILESVELVIAISGLDDPDHALDHQRILKESIAYVCDDA